VRDTFGLMLFPEFKELGLPELLTILASLGFILIVVNYLINYLPLSLFKTARLNTESSIEPVSIIICARNEDENLTEFLPKVLTQDYPEFEVIVVNDCSFDNTENVIDEFSLIFPNLRKANIKEDSYYKHGKKFAMLVGIKAAKYNRLLFTDADCFPSSNHWLKEMASGFSDKKEIILGYGAYEKQSGLLNKLIRFDTFMIAVQYLSSAIKNKPYMGVGRNLAYTKDLFFKEKGFSKHYHINSGDDDLFVNQAATDSNTNVCIHSDAITYSKSKTTFKEWRVQKARHLTTAPLYASATKSRIAFSYFSQYFFYFSIISLSLSLHTMVLIPIFLIIKMLAQWLILNKAAKNLNEKDLLAGSVLFELILLFIYPIFHITKIVYRRNKWIN
jgi:cellulose synthase/poly-beta-1,6-N-acetylglucosamine synthase-like glycosyltransferase